MSVRQAVRHAQLILQSPVKGKERTNSNEVLYAVTYNFYFFYI